MLRVKTMLRSAADSLLRADVAGRQIDDELHFHIEMRTRENIDSGMNPEAARRDALMRFGNFEQIRMTCRKVDDEGHAGLKALKLLLWMVLGIGLSLRLTGSSRGVKPMGDLLAAIAIFLRLLIYVRSLRPDKYLLNR